MLPTGPRLLASSAEHRKRAPSVTAVYLLCVSMSLTFRSLGWAAQDVERASERYARCETTSKGLLTALRYVTATAAIEL
jgi:hypothetical protein